MLDFVCVCSCVLVAMLEFMYWCPCACIPVFEFMMESVADHCHHRHLLISSCTLRTQIHVMSVWGTVNLQKPQVFMSDIRCMCSAASSCNNVPLVLVNCNSSMMATHSTAAWCVWLASSVSACFMCHVSCVKPAARGLLSLCLSLTSCHCSHLLLFWCYSNHYYSHLLLVAFYYSHRLPML